MEGERRRTGPGGGEGRRDQEEGTRRRGPGGRGGQEKEEGIKIRMWGGGGRENRKRGIWKVEEKKGEGRRRENGKKER